MITLYLLLFTIAYQNGWGNVNGAKILAVMPTPSFSHQVFFRPLWEALAKRGHNVTLITTDPIRDKSLRTLREIDVSMVYDNVDAHLARLIHNTDTKLREVDFLFDYFINATRKELLHPEVQELFNNQTIHFDLLMIEDVVPIMFVFKHRFDVPLIGVASLDVFRFAHEAVGNPIHGILYPNLMLPFGNDMHFFQRVIAFVFEEVVSFYYKNWLIPKMDKVIEETVKCTNGIIPSVLELEQRLDMLFINVNPIFGTKRPFTPATISLAGGLHTRIRQSKMSQDLQTFLDESVDGVIYFSLGTNVKSKYLPENLLKIFTSTFSRMQKYKWKVLWKFEKEELDGKPANVKIMKWLPQQEVLRHKNIKLFICQGGLQSLEEALLAGVPVIVIPFFGDQESNANRIVANGIGLQLEYRTLTVELFETAILEVAMNPQYANNVRRHAEIILDQPSTPLDNAVWWTEYVLRHQGAQHLKGSSIPNYQYYYVDFFGFLTVITVTITLLVYFVTRMILREFIFRKSTMTMKKGIKNKNNPNKKRN